MSGLHADAAATLGAWAPPTADQESLRHAYLGFLDARPDACERACDPGHVTASAIVLSRDLTRVALVLHGIVGLWLPPGGHLEASDATLLDAAARETLEETGLTAALDPIPLLLDCHPIACRGRTVPTRHYDVCFAGTADADALVVSDESHDLAWWPVTALPEGVHPRIPDAVAAAVRRLTAAS